MQKTQTNTRKIILLAIAVIASFSFAALEAHAATPSEGLDYCHGPHPFEIDWDESALCYTVKPGDTLWGISEKYRGDGSLWPYLIIRYDYRRSSEVKLLMEDPRTLQPGTKIAIRTYMMEPYPGYPSIGGAPVLDPQTNEIISYSRKNTGEGVVTSGDKIYAGPYSFVKHIRASEDGKNISFFADTKQSGQIKCSTVNRGYQFVVNRVENPHYSCGHDWKLLTYSQSGSHYAIRNNLGDGAVTEKFKVLSDLGNGPYYDYADSIIWADDETIVYRAQNNDEWRIVVNHEDRATFDYIDDIRVMREEIIFRARHDDGSWTTESIHFKK